jgi:hypothetical protein
MREISLLLAQPFALLLGLFSFGDIHRDADVFTDLQRDCDVLANAGI